MSIANISKQLDQEKQGESPQQENPQNQEIQEPDVQEPQVQKKAEEPQQKAEAQGQEKQPQKETKQEKSDEVNFLESFNKQFETSFENEDDIKSILASKDDIGSLKSKLTELEENNKFLESELEKRHEETNPEKLYGSKEAYIKKLTYDKAKEKGIINQKVVDSILSAEDIEKMHDLDILSWDVESQIKNSGNFHKDDIMTSVLEELGVDVAGQKRQYEEKRKEIIDDGDADPGPFNLGKLDVTNSQLLKAKKMATPLREKYRELRKVEPEEWKGYTDWKENRLADIKTKHEELLSKWGDRTDDVHKEFKLGHSYKDSNGEEQSFDFIDKEFNEKDVPEIIRDEIVGNHIEPTKENIEKLKDKIESKFWANKKNREKALTKMLEDARMRTKDSVQDKYNNTSPLNTDKAPSKEEADSVMEEFVNRRKGSLDLSSIWK